MLNKILKTMSVSFLIGALSFAMPVNTVYAQENPDVEFEKVPEDAFADFEEVSDLRAETLRNYSDGDEDLFTVLSKIEKENMLIKLRTEQEKLRLGLEKLKADKQSMEAKMISEKMQREKEAAEEEAIAEKARLERELEYQKIKDESERKERVRELTRDLAEKLTEDPKGDYTALISLLKSENEGVLPKEFLYLDKTTTDGSQSVSSVADSSKDLGKLWDIQSIMGVAGKLVAVVRDRQTNRMFKVSDGTSIDEFLVEKVSPDSISVRVDDIRQVLYLK